MQSGNSALRSILVVILPTLSEIALSVGIVGMSFLWMIAWWWASFMAMSQVEVPVLVPRSLIRVWTTMVLFNRKHCSINYTTSFSFLKSVWILIYEVFNVVSFEIVKLSDVDFAL